ncbi:cupin domain-containing protein [Andreprevotia chitinilytica]|uniref:cupin domain-containing protein n=1 Tax=Andreprevotia chitinilytica TaxID=396808 RepID=UPI0005550CD0|nr:cupin domain-containing protein [Andreprevotia chitinilytica]
MGGIVHFGRQTVEPAYDRPRPDRLEAGNPLRTTFEHYAQDGISCGIWRCETGRWRIQFAPDKHEFFCVMTGRARLHDANGVVTEVGPGEAAVIPAGFVGQFEVVEPVEKYFVVVETIK